jgi:hypothetical protein
MPGKRCQLYRGERCELNGAQYTLGRDYGSIIPQVLCRIAVGAMTFEVLAGDDTVASR